MRPLGNWFHPQSRSFTILLGGLSIFLIVFIIIHPNQSFQSSLSGLTLWWNFVFPGLFPFLMLSEILLGLGVIHALGSLLEPFMRLVFRLPGAAGWALVLGLTGGFPSGSDVTAKLSKQLHLQTGEAQRLWAVSHMCSPMLIIAVIGVGFLNSPEMGFFLAVVHYSAAIAAGLVLRLTYSSKSIPPDLPLNRKNKDILITAARSMNLAYRQDGRTFGKLLGDSVSSTAQTLLAIGGFMIIFSVVHRIILLVIEPFASSELLRIALAGLLEPHLGVYAASQFTNSAVLQAALIGAILGWSGLSLHAQARSMTSAAGLRYGPFLAARLLHAAFAFVLTAALWQPAKLLLGEASLSIAAFTSEPAGMVSLWSSASSGLWPWIGKFYVTAAALLVLLAAAAFLSRKIRYR